MNGFCKNRTIKKSFQAFSKLSLFLFPRLSVLKHCITNFTHVSFLFTNKNHKQLIILKAMSGVWNYFRRDEKDRDMATCMICQRYLQCKRSSTSGLKKHLMHVHKIKLQNFKPLNKKKAMKLKIVKCESELIGETQYEKREVDSELLEEPYDEYSEEVVDDEAKVFFETIEDAVIIEEKPQLLNSKEEQNSFLWNYFNKTSEITAICVQCEKVVVSKNNQMDSLLTHYNTHILNESSNEDIVDEASIAKLFAIDNIPMKTLASSEFFKTSFSSSEGIQNAVKKFYVQCVRETILRISEMLNTDKNIRFSLIVDSSLGLRLVVFIHYI